MFRGASQVTLDTKGRFAIPARYRAGLVEQCDGQLVTTVDRDYCLLLYPAPAWAEIERKLDSLPSLNRQVRRLQRLMIGYATEVELDGHGRVRLPKELREFAGLERHIMLLGQGKKFELWDAERWNERRDTWLREETEESGRPAELESLSL